ncbi:hypothetical protein K439DRAFT_1612167 [Ramaria rubella]|nr:hypothetical protein K439DRAFT_1612167 [Ramaria rubella]
MTSLKQSYESDNEFKGKAPKGKKKRKMASKETNKAFTEIRLVAVLPHGLDADGSLNHTVEPSLLQIDKLVDLGFAKIGGRGDLKFENDWDTQMLDDWLREMLPIAFENIKAVPGVFEDEYPWWLLRTSRSHLELHREKPDGYDAMSAKGKSKGWQDSKLFFVTRLPIPSIIDVIDTLAGHSHKGKGKSVVRKRAVTQGNSDDEVTAKYSTRSKKRKLAAKSTSSEVGEKDVYVIDSDSDEATLSRKAAMDSHEVKSISTPTLVQFEDLEASIVGFHKRRHGFSSPPPTTVNPRANDPRTAA